MALVTECPFETYKAARPCCHQAAIANAKQSPPTRRPPSPPRLGSDVSQDARPPLPSLQRSAAPPRRATGPAAHPPKRCRTLRRAPNVPELSRVSLRVTTPTYGHRSRRWLAGDVAWVAPGTPCRPPSLRTVPLSPSAPALSRAQPRCGEGKSKSALTLHFVILFIWLWVTSLNCVLAYILILSTLARSRCRFTLYVEEHSCQLSLHSQRSDALGK